ncbi:hypothetical protein pb186bvf_000035 [Paramecium bursaria]
MFSQSLRLGRQLFRYSKYDVFGDVDVANMLSAVQPPSPILATDMISKLSYFSPRQLYLDFDIYLRDFMVDLAADYGYGAAILGISIGLKVIFTPFLLSAQIQGLKMKLIEPEMKNMQTMRTRLQQLQDMQGLKQLQKHFMILRKQHGISNLMPFFGMLQIPVLITWFISLRYTLSLPEKYEGVKSQGFLWFQDLSEYDPYMILPVISALSTSLNISLNPNAKQGPTFMKQFQTYLKFVPFLSIPIVIFFPAGLNLYWASSSICQLIISQIGRSDFFLRKMMKVPQYLPGTVLERMHTQKQQNVIKATIEDEKIKVN